MAETLRTIVRVAAGGRIVIPAEVRKRLGLDVGADVIMTVKDDEAVLIGAKAARRRAQQWVRRHVKPGVSLSKELMAERKEEARRE